ncbi:MAG: O-antigen ligase family protein [Candidatus Omnitrophica bacterium]|nr:O-antigen ligase family protein [Candidatus Omnitrophota bacterium]
MPTAHFFKSSGMNSAVLIGIAIALFVAPLSQLPLIWIALIFLIIPVAIVAVLSKDLRMFCFYLFILFLPIAFEKVLFSPNKDSIYPIPVLVMCLSDIPLAGYVFLTILKLPKIRIQLKGDIALLILLFLAWLGWSLLAIPKTMEVEQGGLWSFIFMFIYLLKGLILFVCLSLIPLNQKELKNVVNLLLIGAAIQSGTLLLQHFTKSYIGIMGITPQNLDFSTFNFERYFRASGLFGHANVAGQYFAFLIPLIFCVFLNSRRGFPLVLSGFVFLLSSLALVLTFSRGAWIATFLALALCLMVTLRHALTRDKVIKIFFILSIGCVIFLSYLGPISDRLLLGDEGASGSRIRLAKGAVQVIADHPLVGVGLNNFQEIVGQYGVREASAGFFKNGVLYLARNLSVHNRFLLTAAETGMVGFAFFLSFLLIVLISGFKYITRYKSENSLVSFGLYAAFVGSLFYMQVEIFNDTNILTLFMLVVGLLFNCRALAERQIMEKGYGAIKNI